MTQDEDELESAVDDGGSEANLQFEASQKEQLELARDLVIK